MLSFQNIYKVFGDLKLLATFACPLKNGKFNIRKHNPRVLNSGLITFSSFSTENKQQRFVLEELKNIDVEQYNCDLMKWHDIVDEILQAKNDGKNLPEYLNEDNIAMLLKSESKSQRFKYLTFIFKKEKKKSNKAEKQLRKKAELAFRNAEKVVKDDHIHYGLGKNTLILRAANRAWLKFYNKRLANSVLFGQKIVIDLCYDQFMYMKEKRDLAAQIALVHGINRKNRDPYDVYLCNAKSETESVRCLRCTMPNIDDSLMSLTEQSYLDLFPKENLVYLSPHAAEPLKTYDHKATYIIGGFVDTVKRKDVSFFKSREEGIKSYFLPLDEYVLWGCGSRSLSIDQVFSIMQTVRDTGDWRKAFKHIPTRKLRRINSEQAKCMPDKMFVMSN